MHIRDLIVERLAVATVKADQSVAETLAKINETGFRCIPAVDDEDNYKGMIYKVDLLSYLYEEKGDDSHSINHLLKHQDIYLAEDASFLSALLKIKALPFISVVENGKLLGIITHNKIESVLEDAFGLKTGGINITLASTEARGMIRKLTTTLKDENIEGMLTLDNGSALARRVVLTLEDGKSDEEMKKMRDKLEKNGFRILQMHRIGSK
ncbi:CBS domain-containing protein [Sporosarcina saromensis]|uniref:CBS domain-containing protein n=1 Tax=Sporosarcina saromensis TaxID=359365 RepID=A0ABU4GA36_9BACL|nr:CBS domain-containing protein [Sporosarcina saromensis]MDW0113183.1 CBS domain-containing protein [Sporosarcina saromensis]